MAEEDSTLALKNVEEKEYPFTSEMLSPRLPLGHVYPSGVVRKKPMQDENVYFSERYTYKNRTSDGSCCCKKTIPSTSLKCPRGGHQLLYKTFTEEGSEEPFRCNLCMRRYCEFVGCDECDYHICLDCLHEHESHGCRCLCCCGPICCGNGLCHESPCCCCHWCTPSILPRRPNQKQAYCCCGLWNKTETENKIKDSTIRGFDEVEIEVENIFKELTGKTQASAQAFLEKMFEIFDEEGRGHLILSDMQGCLMKYIQTTFSDNPSFQRALQRFKQLGDNAWKKIFEMVDINGDGMIKKDEFVDKINEIFGILQSVLLSLLQKTEKLAIMAIDQLDGLEAAQFVKRRPKKDQNEERLQKIREIIGIAFTDL